MPKPRVTKKQKQTLLELDRLARRLGLRVSYGDLKYAGLKLKGGQCLFKGEKWVVLDRRQPFEDQVDIFREAIQEYDLSAQDVPPELQGILPRILTEPPAVPPDNP